MIKDTNIDISVKDNDYNNTLNELSNILNVSVSTIEHYPTDLKKLLFQTYINHCSEDKNIAKQAVLNIVNLDKKQVDIIQPKTKANPKSIQKQDMGSKRMLTVSDVVKSKKAYVITRKTILNNAKKIAQSNQKRRIQNQKNSKTVTSQNE